MLKRLGKKYDRLCIKQIEVNRVPEFKDKSDTFLFVDMGSGQIPLLEENIGDKKFAIIDHHNPQGETQKPHFNCHLSGIDGTNEVSGAGCAYLVAKEIDPNNKDLASLAIVGAIGDIQDSKGRLEGLNREILKDAEELGIIKEMKDIRFFGRHSRILIKFLSYCSTPYLPGLTAKEEECRAFLKNLGIEFEKDGYWRKYVDLTEDEKKRLISGLYVYGIQHNVPKKFLKTMVGTVYELPKEKEGTELRDAREFATLLNACGRQGETEIGVEVCMGDRDEFYKKAKNLLQRHRKMLRDGIQWAQDNGTQDFEYMHVLNGENHIKDTLIGIVAGMLYGAGVISRDKPVIGVAVDENNKLKISSRGTWPLIAKGLDLSAALKTAAREVGGEGGGHTIASGAYVPPGKKEQFLKRLNEIIGAQLSKGII
jgi:RecJ-like exonuclease